MRSLLILLPMLALAQNSVKSPDGAIVLSFSADGGALAYSVTFHGRPVLTRSTMALEIQDQAPLGPAVKIAAKRTGLVVDTYSMPHGKANRVRNKANPLALDIEETRPPLRKLTVEV